MKLKFYKETDNRWYVDLPNWEGSKAELEMVAGATMLDYMSSNTSEITLDLDIEPFDGADELKFIRLATELEMVLFIC